MRVESKMFSLAEVNENSKNQLDPLNPFCKLIGCVTYIYNYINVIQYRKFGKRCWDFCSAISIFTILLPLFGLISILIKLDSKGPIIYKQRRVGKNGKIFQVYKFRTMITDSDRLSPTTCDNDPRITRIGKIIRPISLDELPQLLNIIKGDMSFIGPRPLSEEEYNNIKAFKSFPDKLSRDLIPNVNPGILGWAIFNGREKISYEDRCRLNKEYEEKLSLFFDSYISWLTLKRYWFTYLVVSLLFLIIPLSLLALL